ncbi:hypothetical protein [Thalassobacillus devorans]|uniref:hypothetical protein n=1 Tax=Thalassobacillus devorans TaxID=279813 RepID=UPI00048DDC75|nr:hypothetical protein [Thalassobacillus devorans]
MYGYDQESQWTYLTIGIIIIAFMLSILAPITLMTILQDMFHFSRSHWIFMAPISAYIMFGSGFVWIGLMLILFLILQSKREKSPVWVLITGIPVAFLFLVLSLNNYFYFQDDGITYNPIFSISPQHFQWEDIKEINQIYDKSEGTIFLRDMNFQMKNGEEITFNYRPEFWEHQDSILAKAKEAGAVMTDNLAELKN